MIIQAIFVFLFIFQSIDGQEERGGLMNPSSIFVQGIIQIPLGGSDPVTEAPVPTYPTHDPTPPDNEHCHADCALNICPTPDYMQDPLPLNTYDFPVCASDGLTYHSHCMFECIRMCKPELHQLMCGTPPIFDPNNLTCDRACPF